jgi:site-specific DNA-cytosine methylase
MTFESNAQTIARTNEHRQSGEKGEARKPMASSAIARELPPCPWSPRTALDPKHRPQVPQKPSSTVRREWARYPQEAHLLDLARKRIRRLSPGEIVRLQGFDREWFDAPEVPDRDRIRAAGDAVPPPLAFAIGRALAEVRDWENRTHLEICAGAGGLASGLARAGFETLALVDAWPISGRILRHQRLWKPDRVHVRDVRKFDFSGFGDRVGILSGGPPCQPWSTGGARRGERDPRDLMGEVDDLVAMVRPEAFVWENVPGLIRGAFAEYFEDLMGRLRAPTGDLRYGVLAAVLNAADFGVPQIRQRLFIIGLRGGSTREAMRVFDRIDSLATNKDGPWHTVGDILDLDTEHDGWMSWWYDEGSANGGR